MRDEFASKSFLAVTVAGFVLLCSGLVDGGGTFGGAGPRKYSQRNSNRRPNDEFEGSSFMSHRDVLALTYP